MISECLNRDCRKPLHYLREGRIVRTVFQEDGYLRTEHFWLCGECSRIFNFCLFPNEPPTLIRREIPRHAQRSMETGAEPEVINAQQVKKSVRSAEPWTQVPQPAADELFSTLHVALHQQPMRTFGTPRRQIVITRADRQLTEHSRA